MRLAVTLAMTALGVIAVVATVEASPSTTTLVSQPFNATFTIGAYDTSADVCPPGLGPGDWHCPPARGAGLVRGLGRADTSHRAFLDFSMARQRWIVGTITLKRGGTLNFTTQLIEDTEHSFSSGVYAYQFTGGTGWFEGASGSGTFRASGSAVSQTIERWTGTIEGPSVPPLDLAPPAVRLRADARPLNPRRGFAVRVLVNATDASAAEGLSYSLTARAGGALAIRRGTTSGRTALTLSLRPRRGVTRARITVVVVDRAANRTRATRTIKLLRTRA